MAQVLRSLTTDRQHLRAELDRCELYVVAVEVQVAGGAARQLEDPAMCLRADPCASVPEEDPLEKADLPVVFGRLLVLNGADPLRLVRGHRRSSRRIAPANVHQ